MTILIGVDVGSKASPTGICVAEEERRDPRETAVKEANAALVDLLAAGECVTAAELSQRIEAVRRCEEAGEDVPDTEVHFLVRRLEPLPAGTPFPSIAGRVGRIVSRVAERTDEGLAVYVDATGKGAPIIDLLREKVHQGWVEPVFFTHGDRRSIDRGCITMGKAYLVTRLQTLLQVGRLHLPRTPDAEVLAQEMLDYEVRVESDANERYGDFRVGTRDELVTALGLAVHVDPPYWKIF